MNGRKVNLSQVRCYLFKVYELVLKEIRHAQKMHYLLNSFNTKYLNDVIVITVFRECMN